MERLMLAMLLTLALSACATTTDRQEVVSTSTAAETYTLQKATDPTKTAYELSEIDRANLERSFSGVLAFCQERLSGYELQSKTQAKKAFWISLSGLLAGSIISPALTAASAKGNAVWISALSGWGGATNFVSQSYRTSGLSGTTIAETRNKIIDKVGVHIAVASDGDRTFEERKNALMQARAECILYQIAVPSVPSG